MSGDSVGDETPAEATAPQAFTQFETPIPTTYELPLDLQPAVLSPDESAASWLGPVHIAGMSGSRRIWTKEVDKDGVNTLLFTSFQIVGLMLGPADMQYLAGIGPMKTAANQALEKARWIGRPRDGGGVEDAMAKGVQFGALNANHWVDMVEGLTAQPLEVALAGHLNFGLPYDRIQSVEIKSRFINPGLVFHLTNNSRLPYGTFGKRGRLPQAASYLRTYVKVQ